MACIGEDLDRIAADLQHGRFVDPSELLRLIDQLDDGRSTAAGALSGAFSSHKGTTLLVELLEQALTRANIVHQSQLATLTARVRELEVVSERHKQMLKEASFEVVYSFVATLPSIASSASAVVDDDNVEELMDNDTDTHSFDAKTIARVLQQQLQDLSRQLRAMKDNVLDGYRKCQSIINSHGRMLGSNAFSYGVSDPGALARKVVQETTLRILSHAFFQNAECDRLQDDVLSIYASILCNAQKSLAEREISTKTATNITTSPQDFRLGLRIGLGATFFLWSLSEVLTVETLGSDVWLDQTFRIFRGLGDLLLLYWLWGVSLHVWTKYGIDYPRLLEMLPPEWGEHPSKQVWKEAADLSIVYFITFIVFCKVLRGVWSVPGNPSAAHLFPVLLLGWFCYRSLFPWRERKRAWFMLWRVVAAPAFQVSFRDGYVGDILTSTVRVCIDLAFAFGYALLFIYGWSTDNPAEISGDFQFTHTFQYRVVPFLTALPLWLRFMQTIRRAWETEESWPHLGNSLKYASALVVSMFAAFRPELRNLSMWILGFGFATMYQFLWDIFMDWDIIHFTRDGRPHLRRSKLFGSSAIYIAIIVLNFLLRFLWAATLLPESRLSIVTVFLERYFHSFIAAAEIVRRIMWGFLRLENEQLQVFGTQALTAEAIFSSHEVFSELRPHEMSPMEVGTASEKRTNQSRGGYDRLDLRKPTTISERLRLMWLIFRHARAAQISVVLATCVVVLLGVAASPQVPSVL